MTKRIFDILFSLIFILFTIPFVFIIIIILFLLNGSPVIFIQERSGKNKNTFRFYKFRTMNNNLDKDGSLLVESKRITLFGNFLRKTSLDELPSFWNVLKGDMSIVGPRPLLVKYVPRYNEFELRRFEVMPGVTGLAQVKGRNNLSWDKKFKYDVHYVDNHNIFTDIKIIFSTFISVISLKGIYSKKDKIMPEFMGLEKNEFIKED
tara:strand:- start:548 stop:1165 length:618 start_codon:yes stop_codon:yes gene_type:complete